MIPAIKASLVRQMALNLVASEFKDWHDAQVAQFPDPSDRHQTLQSLSAADVMELERIREAMITPDHLRQIRKLLDAMAEVHLYAGDRAHLNEARCSVLNALNAIEKGQFRDAHEHMLRASGRVIWMMEGKKRDGFETKRFLPRTALPKLEHISREANDLVTALARTTVAL